MTLLHYTVRPYHVCVVLEAMSEVEVLDKVLTDLAGIAPGHAATHWTNLRSSK